MALDRAWFIIQPNTAVQRIVVRCSPPDVMEDVERQLLGCFPVADDPHDQRKDDAVRPLVKRMKGEPISCGDGPYISPTHSFSETTFFDLAAIENIAKGSPGE